MTTEAEVLAMHGLDREALTEAQWQALARYLRLQVAADSAFAEFQARKRANCTCERRESELGGGEQSEQKGALEILDRDTRRQIDEARLYGQRGLRAVADELRAEAAMVRRQAVEFRQAGRHEDADEREWFASMLDEQLRRHPELVEEQQIEIVLADGSRKTVGTKFISVRSLKDMLRLQSRVGGAE